MLTCQPRKCLKNRPFLNTTKSTQPARVADHITSNSRTRSDAFHLKRKDSEMVIFDQWKELVVPGDSE